MTQTLSVSLFCPKMAIHKLSADLAQTAVEPMTATLTAEDGTKTIIENVTIPPTFVDRQKQTPEDVLRILWIVRACEGETLYRLFVCSIPPQTCEMDLATLGFAAKAIDASVVYTDVQGRTWKGTVHFPDCEVQWWLQPLEAVPVTAIGTLTLQE
ncbi:MAG: hypothetical protein KGL39_25640 [Patescibacteria group bacterium]|nr:hypothetical protein [Patescibacteria group bacterium]